LALKPSVERGGQNQKEFEQGTAPQPFPWLPGNKQRQGGYGMGSFGAPQPRLTNPVADLLLGFLNNPQQTMQGFLPQSDLQRMIQSGFAQLLQPQAQMQTNMAQANLAGVPGGNVLQAAQPVYNQNLMESLQRQREFGGPRFAAEAGRQAGELEQQSLNDFNLFAANTLQQGRRDFLSELMGGAQTDQGFQGQNLALIQQLLGGAFQGGMGAPVLEQKPGFFGGTLMPLAGLALGAFGGPAGMAAGAGMMGLGGTGRGGTTPPTFIRPKFGGPIRTRWNRP
jgi:hypothetical protein